MDIIDRLKLLDSGYVDVEIRPLEEREGSGLQIEQFWQCGGAMDMALFAWDFDEQIDAISQRFRELGGTGYSTMRIPVQCPHQRKIVFDFAAARLVPLEEEAEAKLAIAEIEKLRARNDEMRRRPWERGLDDLLALRKMTGVQDDTKTNPVAAAARRSISDDMVKAGLDAFAIDCFSSNFVTVVENVYIAMAAAETPRAGMIAPDVAELILSDPRLWSDTIRTIAKQRARLDRQLAGRRKPIAPDDVDCGVPHLLEG